MDDSGKKILPLAVLMDDGVCVCERENRRMTSAHTPFPANPLPAFRLPSPPSHTSPLLLRQPHQPPV